MNIQPGSMLKLPSLAMDPAGLPVDGMNPPVLGGFEPDWPATAPPVVGLVLPPVPGLV
jgi:hypothetical protein